jgi:nitrogen fixation protein NifU and related proteins
MIDRTAGLCVQVTKMDHPCRKTPGKGRETDRSFGRDDDREKRYPMENLQIKEEQAYSEHFIDLASRTNRLGALERPDGYGKRVGDCGDTIEVYLSVRGGQIQMVTFQIQGCLHTNACANALAYLVEGRTVIDSWRITPENLVDYLETLPPDHIHCAELVVGAFYHALNDYNATKHQSWKRAYLKQEP